MRVFVACEFSGVVRRAFRALGHDAWSGDFLAAEDDSPYHIQGDVSLRLRDGWDLLIAHPTCTRLCNSGVKHLYIDGQKENGPSPDHWAALDRAAAFFNAMLEAPVWKVAVENPIMHQHARRLVEVPPTQIIQPWQFGHQEMKATCLWLRGLPKLEPTHVVGPPPCDVEQRKAWAKVHRASPGPNRWKMRSRTYDGIAAAMAAQWGATDAARIRDVA